MRTVGRWARGRRRTPLQRIVGALVQTADFGGIEALFVDFEPGASQRLRGKLLDGKADGFRGPREAPVADGVTPHPPTGKKLRLSVVVEGRHSESRVRTPR